MENESQKKQIEYIFSVIRDVLKEWWVILCIAISVSFLSYIGAYLLYQPTYTSSTTFVVSAKTSSMGAYGNLSEVQKLTDTFQTVMDSQVLKKKVAESLEMEAFDGTVGISVVPETNLLTVTVTSDSPEIAFQLLNGLLDHYQEVGENVLGNVVMEVFEEPNYPSVPNTVFDGKDVMQKAFLVAFAAMVVLLAVLSYLKDSVKLEEEVTEKLDTTLFGVLEHESSYRNAKAFIKRQKKKILMTEPAVSFSFVETVKKMRTKLMYFSRKEDAKVILVTSVMKKEGKSTVAANLALSMAQKGEKVLLIEGDLRKSALAEFLGVEVPEGAGITGDLDTVDLSKAVFQMDDSSLYLLTNGGVHRKSTEFLVSETFVNFLAQMREEMDYIIIDGPPAKGRADAEVLVRLVDCSLLVVKQNYAKVPFINDTIDMLNSYGSGVAGCIFNDVYTSGTLSSSGYGY